MPRLVVNLNDTRPVWAMPDWVLPEIQAALPPGWEVAVVRDAGDGRGDGGGASEEAHAAIRGAEVYLGYGFTPSLLEAAGESLRWVHSGSAGVGSALFPEMRASPVVLTNSAGVHAPPMAETVLAMMLYFSRGLDFAVRAQRGREWGKPHYEAADTPVGELAGATLGIVGLGGIGREVAARGRALGMRVAALRRGAGEGPEGVEVVRGEGALHDLLARSDYLVLTVPETEATRGMIGAAELARMKPSAVLVNVARGGVVDEEALVAHLREGRLRGAGLDVFRQEPLPPESPLWELPSVLITPHVSATSRAFWRRETELVVDNLHRYLGGKPLRNVVDKQAGY